jgi:hypothetical protein
LLDAIRLGSRRVGAGLKTEEAARRSARHRAWPTPRP